MDEIRQMIIELKENNGLLKEMKINQLVGIQVNRDFLNEIRRLNDGINRRD